MISKFKECHYKSNYKLGPDTANCMISVLIGFFIMLFCQLKLIQLIIIMSGKYLISDQMLLSFFHDICIQDLEKIRTGELFLQSIETYLAIVHGRTSCDSLIYFYYQTLT